MNRAFLSLSGTSTRHTPISFLERMKWKKATMHRRTFFGVAHLKKTAEGLKVHPSVFMPTRQTCPLPLRKLLLSSSTIQRRSFPPNLSATADRKSDWESPSGISNDLF